MRGVDWSSGRKASSSSRSKLDESWSRVCRILGCLRLGFSVPSIEFSRVGVGCTGRRTEPGAFTAEDVAAGGGAVSLFELVGLFMIPFA